MSQQNLCTELKKLFISKFDTNTYIKEEKGGYVSCWIKNCTRLPLKSWLVSSHLPSINFSFVRQQQSLTGIKLTNGSYYISEQLLDRGIKDVLIFKDLLLPIFKEINDLYNESCSVSKLKCHLKPGDEFEKLMKFETAYITMDKCSAQGNERGYQLFIAHRQKGTYGLLFNQYLTKKNTKLAISSSPINCPGYYNLRDTMPVYECDLNRTLSLIERIENLRKTIILKRYKI